MKHTCRYCTNEFEGSAGAVSCSKECRKAYSYVLKYWRLHPEASNMQPVTQPVNKVDKAQSAKQPITQPKPEPTQSRWQQVQEYKKRHKFDV